MKKAMGLAGMLVLWMSACGPAETETEQAPDAIELGQQRAAIGPNQAWLTTYYSNASKTQVIGYHDGCPLGGSWGSTSQYYTNSVITCVGSPADP